MTLVRIPAGTFQMGGEDGDDDERPVHPVTISRSFYMGEYEVTQAQYEAVMAANPSDFQGDTRCPVEHVNWHDAVAFCQALAMRTGRPIRLPTEAEWEYACKADKGNVDVGYYFGDDAGQLGDYAWYDGNSGWTTHPVGQKPPNSFGLYDMHGNVWGWCQDWYHNSYSGAPADGSAWETPAGSTRILRSGSWDTDARYCRLAARTANSPANGYSFFGFRVVSGD